MAKTIPNDHYIANVVVTKAGDWIDVKDTNGNTYSLTQFGVTKIKNIKKGTKATLRMRKEEHFTFLYLTP